MSFDGADASERGNRACVARLGVVAVKVFEVHLSRRIVRPSPPDLRVGGPARHGAARAPRGGARASASATYRAALSRGSPERVVDVRRLALASRTYQWARVRRHHTLGTGLSV